MGVGGVSDGFGGGEIILNSELSVSPINGDELIINL